MQDDLARGQADMATDLTPANISELGRAIDQTRDPKLRAILIRELDRLRGLAGNLLGPVAPPAQFAPPVGTPTDAVWRPGEQPVMPQRIPTMPFQPPSGVYDG
jgi:hypothetical protein